MNHMRVRGKWVGVVGLVLLSLPARASAQSYQDLIKLFEDNNSLLQADRTEIERVRALRTQTTAPSMPRIGLEEMTGAMSSHYFVFELGFKFPVADYYRYQAANQLIDVAQARFKKNYWSQLAQLKEAYFGLYTAEQQLSLTHANWTTVQEFARIAEKRYASGQAGKHEAMRAHVELTRLEIATLKLKDEVDEQRQKLWQLVDGRISPDFSVKSQTLKAPAERPNQLAQLDVVGLVQSSPKVAELFSQAEVSRKNQQVEFWSWAPDFRFSYKQSTNEMVSSDQQVMFTMSLPLWFWAKSAGDRSARAETLKANYRLRTAQLAAQAQISLYRQKLQRGLRTLEVYETSLIPQAQTSYQFAAANYRTARGQFGDFLESEKALYDVKSGYYSALQVVVQQAGELEALAGRELFIWGSGGHRE